MSVLMVLRYREVKDFAALAKRVGGEHWRLMSIALARVGDDEARRRRVVFMLPLALQSTEALLEKQLKFVSGQGAGWG